MSEVIGNAYLVSMKEQLIGELRIAEKQNYFFKEQGLYPEYNMNDIILALQTQIDTINDNIALGGQDYNTLYPPVSSPDAIMLIEDLVLKEQALIKDTAGATDLIDGLTSEYEDSSDTIDMIIEKATKENRLEAMANELKQDLGMTEDDIINNLDLE